MGRTKTIQRKTILLNTQTEIDYYNRLKEIALSRFIYENLPDTVDPRFLELQLYSKGMCLFFNDDVIGNLALPCTIDGPLDVYNIPLYRRAYASNGYQAKRSKADSVIIFNNYLHTPTDETVRLFAQRMANIERTIDININAQKTPLMIRSDERQRLSMKQLYAQYDGNYPFIFADKGLSLDSVSVLNTTAPYVADKLQLQKQKLWNEALTFLGVENSNTGKKERLVSTEAFGNYGNIEAQRTTFLMSRKEAIEKINKMFNLDIQVRYNSNLQTLVNYDNIEDKRSEEIEEVELNG